MKAIIIVTGGQWGSESKGALTGYLTHKAKVDIAVRTGATNAGHSVDYNGRVYVNQQLPVSWTRFDTQLVLGAGAVIDPAILDRECDMINNAFANGSDVRKRLTIDPRAYVHRPIHGQRSASSGRHHGIGATGKGCSEAVVDRIRLRGVEDGTVRNFPSITSRYRVADTEKMLNRAVDEGAQLLLEGCQGTLLDLALGPYPFTTHKQTGPAVWMAEAGLSPALPTNIVMVVRTFPIRVAGNSGPMPMEISWPQLAREINQRRISAGLTAIVSPTAISAFEHEVVGLAKGEFQAKLPIGSDGLDMHAWQPDSRIYYREALSELHKAALSQLDEPTVAELKRLFEMTTVTKKLRRIARLTRADLETAARQVRPHQVAVTFMNYITPERWFTDDAVTDAERLWLMEKVEVPCRAPVTLINRGPLAKHIIEVRS